MSEEKQTTDEILMFLGNVIFLYKKLHEIVLLLVLG